MKKKSCNTFKIWSHEESNCNSSTF